MPASTLISAGDLRKAYLFFMAFRRTNIAITIRIIIIKKAIPNIGLQSKKSPGLRSAIIPIPINEKRIASTHIPKCRIDFDFPSAFFVSGDVCWATGAPHLRQTICSGRNGFPQFAQTVDPGVSVCICVFPPYPRKGATLFSLKIRRRIRYQR